MAGAGTPIGTIIQALKYLGSDNIDVRTIDKLKRTLSANDKRGSEEGH